MDDLLSVLEDALGHAEKRSRGNYRFKCPLPGCSSVRKRLEILVDGDDNGDNPWKCWVCLKGGLSIRSLFRQANLDPKYFQRLNGCFKYVSQDHNKKQTYLSLPSEFKSLLSVGNNDFVGRRAKFYLKGRGITEELIAKYQLGYCETGRYSNRIIIPSFDSDGYLNNFAARSFLEDEDERYLYPQFDRGDIIPFELYVNWDAPITLCEGYLDAIAIMRNAIPLLEKGISSKLLSKILGSDVDKIYVVLDKDAMKEALDHANMLLVNGKIVYLVELEGKDPSKMGFTAFTSFIQTAKALTPESLFMKKMMFKLS